MNLKKSLAALLLAFAISTAFAVTPAAQARYTNVYGHRVHSPVYRRYAPVGASAQCGDGTYSFSQSRRGTCSHHSGVAQWLP